MGIDAVAVLNITGLIAPLNAFGISRPVRHLGNASLVSTLVRFNSQQADEHALDLRVMLGSALDAHHDLRGILFFPDTSWPKSEGYEAIVAEMSGAGIWAPKVEADHIPARYSTPGGNPHDLLTGQLIKVLGRDEALRLAGMVEVNFYLTLAGRDAGPYCEQLTKVSTIMGEDFAARYDASLRERVEAAERASPAVAGLISILPIQLDGLLDAEVKGVAPVPAGLTPREERVLRLRAGIDMNTGHTLEEVARAFSVPRARIRQIEAKALRKLKHPSRSRKLQSLLDR